MRDTQVGCSVYRRDIGGRCACHSCAGSFDSAGPCWDVFVLKVDAACGVELHGVTAGLDPAQPALSLSSPSHHNIHSPALYF